MNRRKFIKSGALFVPVAFGIFVPKLSAQLARNPGFYGTNRVAASGGGAWTDCITPGSTDTDGFSVATEWQWMDIALGAGTYTKARIYLSAVGGGNNIKMALHAPGAGGALLANGTATSGSAGAYTEITFGTPYAGSAATYHIGWEADGANLTYRYLNGAGSWHSDAATAYAAAPPSPLSTPVFDLSRNYAVGVFVT